MLKGKFCWFFCFWIREVKAVFYLLILAKSISGRIFKKLAALPPRKGVGCLRVGWEGNFEF